MLAVSIVGCGLIATQKYLPILSKLKQTARVVGLCELDREKLEGAARKFSIAHAYTDLEQMLSQQKPDLAIICTPPATHASLAVQAMEGGAHVLLEKPMALTIEECDAINQAAKKHSRKVGVMHNQLFNPAFMQAREIMSRGEIGEFVGMRIMLVTNTDYMTSHKDHWAHKLPGGVLGETGPHAVYLSLACLQEVNDVQLRYRKVLPDYPWSIGEDIRFDLIAKNGFSSIALVYASRNTAMLVDIIGTDALLCLDLEGRILVKYGRKGALPTASEIGRSVLSNTFQQGTGLLRNVARLPFSEALNPHYIGTSKFLEHLTNGAEFPSSGEDGKRVVSTMAMVVRRLREAKPS